MKRIRYSFFRIIGKDGVFVCLFLYVVNYNYSLKGLNCFSAFGYIFIHLCFLLLLDSVIIDKNFDEIGL
ncbi:hypothetical protein BUM91_11050 [Bacillus thuringiensis]|nr:hypothetical protein BUM91_11050 [Bacillus thuringiensis]